MKLTMDKLKEKMLYIDSKIGYPLSSVVYFLRFYRNQIAYRKMTNQHEVWTFGNFSHFASLCDFYGSDKGSINTRNRRHPWPAHNYSEMYERLFYSQIPQIQNVLECGIGTTNLSIPSNMSHQGSPGASLRVLRDYFPNAEIIGIDIDKDSLFEEDRIRTYQVDQTSKVSIQKFLEISPTRKFDLIIDDGLHEYQAAITLFENTIDCLNHKGIYIIEDIQEFDFVKYVNYFSTKKHVVDIIKMYREKEFHKKRGDNNCIVIRNSR
jgi:hypothetical protein